MPRSASIVSGPMMLQILISACTITSVCLAILFLPAVRGLFGAADDLYLRSAVFATFMMAIAFNSLNARTERVDLFRDLGQNWNFIWVMGAILLLQWAFVTFGGKVLEVEALSLESWGICCALASLVLPIDVVRKLLSRDRLDRAKPIETA